MNCQWLLLELPQFHLKSAAASSVARRGRSRRAPRKQHCATIRSFSNDLHGPRLARLPVMLDEQSEPVADHQSIDAALAGIRGSDKDVPLAIIAPHQAEPVMN